MSVVNPPSKPAVNPTSKPAVKSDDDIKFVPLTDDDVDIIVKKTNKLNKEDFAAVVDIYNKFSQSLNGLILVARKQTNEEKEIIELERVKRIINFLPIDEKFIRVKDKVWAVRNHILKKNIKYFLDKDYSHAIKKDQKQVMIETIIEIARDKFVTLPQKEQDVYWKKATELLHCVAKFKQLIGEE